jgi:hypothetical protein
MSSSSIRKCKVCRKSGNNCKGSIRQIKSESRINQLNVFFDRNVVEGDDVCDGCIYEVKYFLKKNPSTILTGNNQNINASSSEIDIFHNNNEIEESNYDYNNNNFNDQIESKAQYEPETNVLLDQLRTKNKTPTSRIKLDLSKAFASHRKCIICFHVFETNKFSKYKKQKLIGLDARVEAFIETGVYIVEGSRCCLNHLNKDSTHFKEEALLELRSVNEMTFLKESECSDLIEALRDYAKNNSVFEKFKNPYAISEKLCKKTTGRSTEEFLIMYNSLTMNESKNRSKSQALAIYLFWLKTGMTQETIAAYFGSNLKQIDISHINEQVRTHLDEFVNKNYGSKHLTREMLIEHNSAFVNKSFGTKRKQIVALLADATYFEIGKSKNHLMQRISFSVPKNYNLIKPMVVCLSNGYIVEIYGPYPANMNDAQILKDILETDTNLHSLLREGM